VTDEQTDEESEGQTLTDRIEARDLANRGGDAEAMLTARGFDLD
jgi:hypothetical protein